MKVRFSDFYGPSEQECNEIWQKAIVTFDSSSLLGLYELSPESRSEILSVMKSLKQMNRLWIPHQVGLEFHSNRVRVAKQSYEATTGS